MGFHRFASKSSFKEGLVSFDMVTIKKWMFKRHDNKFKLSKVETDWNPHKVKFWIIKLRYDTRHHISLPSFYPYSTLSESFIHPHPWNILEIFHLSQILSLLLLDAPIINSHSKRLQYYNIFLSKKTTHLKTKLGTTPVTPLCIVFNAIVSTKTNPLWKWAILPLLLCKCALGTECFLWWLYNTIRNKKRKRTKVSSFVKIVTWSYFSGDPKPND